VSTLELEACPVKRRTIEMCMMIRNREKYIFDNSFGVSYNFVAFCT
jgi:hypothetical protein